jgi:hypothetical protein
MVHLEIKIKKPLKKRREKQPKGIDGDNQKNCTLELNLGCFTISSEVIDKKIAEIDTNLISKWKLLFFK